MTASLRAAPLTQADRAINQYFKHDEDRAQDRELRGHVPEPHLARRIAGEA